MNTSNNNLNNFYLWQYLSLEAAAVKDKLWTIATWLFTLMGGVLAFIVKGLKPDALVFQEPVLMIVVASVGIVLSAYNYWMITEYGWHVRTAWNRTDFLRAQIDGLGEVWQAGYDKNEHTKLTLMSRIMNFLVLHFVFFRRRRMELLPPFTHRLLALCVLFGAAILGIVILSIN